MQGLSFAQRLLVAVLLVVGFAGCLGQGGARAGLPAGLAFDGLALDVATTPDEPNEPRNLIRVGWEGEAFGIEAAAEPDLPRQAIVLSDAVATSSGLAWIEYTRAALGDRTLSNRFVLWDLPRLLATPGLGVSTRQEGDHENTTASGTVTLDGLRLELSLWVRSRGGELLEAGLSSPQGRESPYRFVPSAPLSFPLAPPANIRPAPEVAGKDAQNQPGHTQVVQWVSAYQRRAGGLPDRVDAESLRIEVLVSGKPWPQNTYDGQGLRSERVSGHFLWTKCSANDGIYVGYGWDSVLVAESYGRGCAGTN